MTNTSIVIALTVVLIVVTVAALTIFNGGGSSGGDGGTQPTARQYSVWPSSYIHSNGFITIDPSPILCPNDSSCTSTSATSVTCPNSSTPLGCQTTLPVAQAICDATPACNGIIFHVADSTQFATPVISPPADLVDKYDGGYGSPAVYLSPGDPPYGALVVNPTANYYGPYPSLPNFAAQNNINIALSQVAVNNLSGVLVPPAQDPFYIGTGNIYDGYLMPIIWSGNLPPPTTPPITPYGGYIFTLAAPVAQPIPPFTGWAAGGNQYVIDYATQYNLSKWQGVTSNDTVPITCPDQTLVPGGCATDLATAGSICDNTPGCVGLIYNISDPVFPTATPVGTTPVAISSGALTGPEARSVFMTPVANETSGDIYFSVDAEPNTVQGAGINLTNPLVYNLQTCYNNNETNANSCGGVLLPSYNSEFQFMQPQTLPTLMSILYDSLTTSSPAPAYPTYTNAISLTYNSVL